MFIGGNMNIHTIIVSTLIIIFCWLIYYGVRMIIKDDLQKKEREQRGKKHWEELNLKVMGLKGLDRLKVFRDDVEYSDPGYWSTITDIIDTLTEYEERLKKIESGD